MKTKSLRERNGDSDPIPGPSVILGISIPEAHEDDGLD